MLHQARLSAANNSNHVSVRLKPFPMDLLLKLFPSDLECYWWVISYSCYGQKSQISYKFKRISELDEILGQDWHIFPIFSTKNELEGDAIVRTQIDGKKKFIKIVYNETQKSFHFSCHVEVKNNEGTTQF